jgi:hypothetical protein
MKKLKTYNLHAALEKTNIENDKTKGSPKLTKKIRFWTAQMKKYCVDLWLRAEKPGDIYEQVKLGRFKII